MSKSIETQLKEAKLKRWKLAAKREEQELKIKKLKTEERMCNLCRIDMALDAFNEFLKPWVDWVRRLPDMVYDVTKCNPDQYREIQKKVDDIIQYMKNKYMYLGIESTHEQKEKATAKWYESMSK